jgi:hypothetical protein
MLNNIGDLKEDFPILKYYLIMKGKIVILQWGNLAEATLAKWPEVTLEQWDQYTASISW